MRPARNASDIAATGPDVPIVRRIANPVLRLQREVGNRATGRLLARAPATPVQGTAQVGKLPAIKIVGGNVGEWAAKKDPRTLEITSKKGKHSSGLARLSKDGHKIPSLKVTTPVVDQSGQHLDFGSVVIELGRVRIADYTVDGNLETWRAVNFETAQRTTISHRTGI